MLYIARRLKKITFSFFFKIKYLKRNIIFQFGSVIDNKCELEGYNSIGENSQLISCSLGRGTYVGRNSELNKIKIGRFCSFGSFITNTTGNHPTKKFVSTHPAFFSEGKAAGFTFMKETIFTELKFVNNEYLVSVGNDVWVGDHVIILDGITIGDGAIIGSGSVVTKDIEPYTINVGIPTRIISKRFSDDDIEFLLNYKWWDEDWNWIESHSLLFNNICKLRELKRPK